MADDHMYVAKVKGSVPEQFLFITFAADYSQVVRTSGIMSEKDLRATLSKAGMPDLEITDRIEHARTHPT